MAHFSHFCFQCLDPRTRPGEGYYFGVGVGLLIGIAKAVWNAR